MKNEFGIIFDLDGTLWDSTREVAVIWCDVFRRHGLSEITPEKIASFMGYTMDEIGRRLFPDMPECDRQAIMDEIAAEESRVLCKTGAHIYPGLKEMLREAGEIAPMYIVSNCQCGYIEAFIEAYDLQGVFRDIEMSGRTGRPKGENIRLIMARGGIDRAVYIGDTVGDEKASRLAGIPFIHAAYGFGEAQAPDAIVRDIKEIPSVVRKFLKEEKTMNDISILAVELPEDIMKAKWAGDFAFALKRIDKYLETSADCIRERLLLEKRRIEQLDSEYPYSRQQALERMQALIPDFTEEELTACDLDGATEYIYKKGEKFYHEDFDASLCKMLPELGNRAGKPQSSADTCGKFIAEVKEKAVSGRRFTMRTSLKIKDEYFVSGETYTIWLPLPAASAQLSDIKVLRCSHTPYHIADENAAQRTVCFRETLTENEEFFVEYAFTNTIRYFDAWNLPEAKVFYPNALPPEPCDLEEQLPHIKLSPTIRALAKEIAGTITDPFLKARAFYDYVTTNVRYSFMRAYALIDDAADYCAATKKGDCGIQAILFMALCRVSGIPARWQSGLTSVPGDAGCHDWAQFYIEEYGWLFADPSFGGGGVRRGNEERRRFYFGNLDAYRMPANRIYQADFDPPKKYIRRDPFDSQTGEYETEKGPMDVRACIRHSEVLSCEIQ